MSIVPAGVVVSAAQVQLLCPLCAWVWWFLQRRCSCCVHCAREGGGFCSAGAAAAGRTLKPVVVGKAKDFGDPGDGGRKLKQMREWVIPGLGRLGDHIDIHANDSGFFDTKTHSDLVLSGTVAAHAKEHQAGEWSLFLHDAAPTHKGQVVNKHTKEVIHHNFDHKNKAIELNSWLRAMRVEEGNIPAGWTSRRPNDQRMYNFIWRWKYDQCVGELGNKLDMREPAADTNPLMVLAAIALTTAWMNNHPECTVAAWLMSGIATEQDYQQAGMESLLHRAKAAMHDPEFREITTEYQKAATGGVWDVTKIFTMHEVHHALAAASNSDNHAEVEAVVGEIPWLAASTSACRKRYSENLAQAESKKKKTASAAVLAASLDEDERRKKIAAATAAASKKLRDETAAKRAAAAQRAAENERKLVREETVEYLRLEFGKKQTPTLPALLETLSKACKCHLTCAPGYHKETCSMKPSNLRGTLARHLQNRAHIQEQLRQRTSLSAAQRESALLHLFGPCSTAASSASGTGSRSDTLLQEVLRQPKVSENAWESKRRLCR